MLYGHHYNGHGKKRIYCRRCYHKAVHFLNGVRLLLILFGPEQHVCVTCYKMLFLLSGLDLKFCIQGCICNNGLISTINVLTVVPRYAKEGVGHSRLLQASLD